MHNGASNLSSPLQRRLTFREADKLDYWRTLAFAIKLKVKVVAVQAMKVYTRMDMHLHSFLTSVQDGCDWSTSRPGRFNPPQEQILVRSEYDSGWTTQLVLAIWKEEKKICCSCRYSSTGSSSP